MIEMRWKLYKWTEWTETGTIQHQDEPALQTRRVTNILEVANELQPPIWSEWIDVPTVVEEE